MKTCTKCVVVKALSLFSTNKKSRDGLHSWCRPCVNAQRVEKRDVYAKAAKVWVQNNLEHVQTLFKARAATPEYKKMKSLSDKKYRDTQGAALKLKKQNYYADKQHLRRAEYTRNKQGYIARAYQRLYKIKSLTPANADKTKIQWFYAEAQRQTDLLGIKHEVDHIFPICKGGLHHQDNLQVLPWLANRKKGGRTLEKIIDMKAKK